MCLSDPAPLHDEHRKRAASAALKKRKLAMEEGLLRPIDFAVRDEVTILKVIVPNFQKAFEKGVLEEPKKPASVFHWPYLRLRDPMGQCLDFEIRVEKYVLMAKVTTTRDVASAEVPGWCFYAIPDVDFWPLFNNLVLEKSEVGEWPMKWNKEPPLETEVMFSEPSTACMVALICTGGRHEFDMEELRIEKGKTGPWLRYHPRRVSPIAEFWGSVLPREVAGLQISKGLKLICESLFLDSKRCS